MTNNLRDEIQSRLKVCIPGNQRQDELFALADAVAALEKMVSRRSSKQWATDAANSGAKYRHAARAALAQIAGRLGHMDVGREDNQ